MAVLQKIRNRAGLLIAIVIGLALLAFILGDFVGQGGAMFNRDRFVIAEVSGKEINYQEYEQKVDYLIQISNLFSQQSSMDEEQIEQTRTQAWEQLIRSHVMEDEYESLGLEVNAEEVFDMVQGQNIHPIVRQLFTNPQTGQVNPSDVIRFLKNMDQQQRAYWLFLEQEMIKERKFTKYNNLIAKGLYVPEPIARLEAENTEKTVDFRYLSQPFSAVPDSLISVSERDIKTHYKENKADYKQEETTVDLEYVSFKVTPSERDVREAEEWINRIKPEFAAEEENIDFVNLNSDEPYEPINYRKDELSERISDFMFNADEGELYGPYFENGAYKLAKLHDVHYIPDSLRLRHILIQGGRRPEDAQRANQTADSLINVLENGGDFAQLAAEFSADQQTAADGGNIGWVEEGTLSQALNDTALYADLGEIKKVTTTYGAHIIEVQEKSPVSKHVDVAFLIRNVTPSSETYQKYYSRASEFAGTNRTYEDFVQAAQSEGLTKKVANDVQIADKDIAGFEQSPRQIIRWAFEADPRTVSPVFEIGDQYVVAAIADKTEEGYQSLDQVREAIVAEVKKAKKSQRLIEKFNALKAEHNALDQMAGELEAEVKMASGIRFSSYYVPQAGVEPKLVAAATSLPAEVLSKPIAGNNGVYLFEVTSVFNPDNLGITQVKEEKISSYQQRANFEAYQTLRELANIKDYRYKFY